jgi:hypothetical protein
MGGFPDMTHAAPDSYKNGRRYGTHAYNVRILVLCAAFALSASGQSVIPLDSFVHFLQETDARVNKQLKREFARELEHLDRLKAPMKVGDAIALSVIRGQRTESISGRFNGIINNNYVKISSYNILLKDVEEQQRELLIWSQKIAEDAEQATEDLATKRMQLHARMLRRKRFLVGTVYSERGYQSPDHVLRNFLVIGDKICSREYLNSSGKISLTVRRTKGMTTVDCQIRGASGMKIALLVRGKAVAQFDLEENQKGSVTFSIMAEDVDGPLATIIGDYFMLLCHRPGIGTWPMSVRPGALPSSLRTDGAVVEQIRYEYDLGKVVTHSLKLKQLVEYSDLPFIALQAAASKYQERLAKLTAPPPLPPELPPVPTPEPSPEVAPATDKAATPGGEAATSTTEASAPDAPLVPELPPKNTGGGFGEIPVSTNKNP